MAKLDDASTTTGTFVAQEIVNPKALLRTPMLPTSTKGFGNTSSLVGMPASVGRRVDGQGGRPEISIVGAVLLRGVGRMGSEPKIEGAE